MARPIEADQLTDDELAEFGESEGMDTDRHYANALDAEQAAALNLYLSREAVTRDLRLATKPREEV